MLPSAETSSLASPPVSGAIHRVSAWDKYYAVTGYIRVKEQLNFCLSALRHEQSRNKGQKPLHVTFSVPVSVPRQIDVY